MHRNFIFSEIQIPPINVPRLLRFEYLVGENKRKNEQREKENSACSSGRFEADFVSLWTRCSTSSLQGILGKKEQAHRAIPF